MIETFTNWAANSPLNTWVLSWSWTWVVLETLHFIGLSILIGSLLVVDLRLLGFFKRLPIQAMHQLMPWAAMGFAINLLTGLLFLFGDPGRYTINIGFQIKFALILMAGPNALWFAWAINRDMRSWEPHGPTSGLAKTIGAVSLGLWFAVLVLGRLIPYVGTG